MLRGADARTVASRAGITTAQAEQGFRLTGFAWASGEGWLALAALGWWLTVRNLRKRLVEA